MRATSDILRQFQQQQQQQQQPPNQYSNTPETTQQPTASNQPRILPDLVSHSAFPSERALPPDWLPAEGVHTPNTHNDLPPSPLKRPNVLEGINHDMKSPTEYNNTIHNHLPTIPDTPQQQQQVIHNTIVPEQAVGTDQELSEAIDRLQIDIQHLPQTIQQVAQQPQATHAQPQPLKQASHVQQQQPKASQKMPVKQKSPIRRKSLSERGVLKRDANISSNKTHHQPARIVEAPPPTPPTNTSTHSNTANYTETATEAHNHHRPLKQALSQLDVDQALSMLPRPLIESYKAMGISQIYRWQSECLQLQDLLTGQRNLVYSAPTGSGKTLVAEVLIAKCFQRTGKQALLVEPFVSAVAEKVQTLKRLYSRKFTQKKLKVGGYYAQSRTRFPIEKADLAICTIEKANSYINKLIEDGQLKQLGIVVVDELHLVGDPSRGYLLELMLSKLRYLCGGDVQIVGMSATLPNIDLLSRWLRAHLYVSKSRPVPLQEFVVVKNRIMDAALHELRTIELTPHPKDPDFLVPLCYEVVKDKKSVLVFCSSKDACEKCASNIASLIFSSISADVIEKRKMIISQLSRTPGGLDPVLEHTVPIGVAFHHAGLTLEERDIIEQGFRQGSISILCATSTLASGVNLPAKRVIIRSPYIGRAFIDSKSYQQMRGRAGRKGDSSGECFLLVKHTERERARHLLNDELEPVHSCLYIKQQLPTTAVNDGGLLSMSRALLEVVACQVCKTETDLFDYARNTLCYSQLSLQTNTTNHSTSHHSHSHSHAHSHSTSTSRSNSLRKPSLPEANDPGLIIKAAMTKALDYLSECGMIILKAEGESVKKHWQATQLGQAVFASSLSPPEGLQVYYELERAMRRFVLRGDLFTVYQITPTYFTIDPDWQAFLRIHGALDEQSRDSAEVIGVRESFLMSACQGILPSSNSSSRPHSGGSGKTPMSDREQLKHIHQRFYSALMLHDLIRERPWPEILQRFKVNRGTLQMLQLTASTFAGMLATFCQRLQWTNLQLLIHQFQERLSFGVCADLIDLCRLPSMRSSHARLLFERGYTTVGALAMASADSVAQILTLSRPYQPPSTNATSNATANATAKKTVMDARSINAMNALDRRLAATLVKEAVCLIKEEREMLAKQIGNIETNETSSDDEEEDSITNE